MKSFNANATPWYPWYYSPRNQSVATSTPIIVGDNANEEKADILLAVCSFEDLEEQQDKSLLPLSNFMAVTSPSNRQDVASQPRKIQSHVQFWSDDSAPAAVKSTTTVDSLFKKKHGAKKQGRSVVSIDTSEDVLKSNHYGIAQQPCLRERGDLGHALSAQEACEMTAKNVDISSPSVEDGSQHVPAADCSASTFDVATCKSLIVCEDNLENNGRRSEMNDDYEKMDSKTMLASQPMPANPTPTGGDGSNHEQERSHVQHASSHAKEKKKKKKKMAKKKKAKKKKKKEKKKPPKKESGLFGMLFGSFAARLLCIFLFVILSVTLTLSVSLSNFTKDVLNYILKPQISHCLILSHVLLVFLFSKQVYQNVIHVPGVARPEPPSLNVLVTAADNKLLVLNNELTP